MKPKLGKVTLTAEVFFPEGAVRKFPHPVMHEYTMLVPYGVDEENLPSFYPQGSLLFRVDKDDSPEVRYVHEEEGVAAEDYLLVISSTDSRFHSKNKLG